MTLFPWTKKANETFFIVLICQFVLALIIAGMTGTWTEAIVIGGLIIAFPLFMVKSMPAAQITHYAVAVAVQLMTALHIQQAMGLIEMHFEIFVLLAFLSIYREWKVILVSTLTVAVHHVLFFALQVNEVAVYAFEEGHVSFGILVIHALFAVAEGVVLMLITRATDKEGQTGYYLVKQMKQVLEKDGQFNLSVDLQEHSPELKGFKKLITSFGSLIQNAKQSSDDANQLSIDVSNSTQSICNLVNQNTEQVNSIATAIEEMSVTNSEVASRATSSTEIASNAATSVTEAKNTIENVSSEIEQLNTELNDTDRKSVV